MRPRSLKPPLPCWPEEAHAHRPEAAAPTLAGRLEVDVAIVGGGYTGLWTALALRELDPSLRIALLEARRIGVGPSGRNGGFLHGYWSSLPTLRDVLGDGAALRLAHASSRIVPSVRAFLEQRGEDVWLHEDEHTPVTAVQPGRLDTPAGTVRAAEIVLALNAWATAGRSAGGRRRSAVLSS